MRAYLPSFIDLYSKIKNAPSDGAFFVNLSLPFLKYNFLRLKQSNNYRNT
jgi:hypothetical protein